MSRYVNISDNLHDFKTCCSPLAIQDWYNVTINWYNIPKKCSYYRENFSGQTTLVKPPQLFQLIEMIPGKSVSASATASILEASVNTAVLFWNPSSSQPLKA